MLTIVKRSSSASQGSVALAPLTAESERILVQRCVAGERAAQDELYLRFRRQVASGLARVLGQHHELDDLVQEVFVIAFRGLAAFRGDARLGTWIYRVCVNVALGRIRQRKRRPADLSAIGIDQVSPAEGEQAVWATHPEAPDRAIERRQAQELVYRLLDQLAPKKRMVLYLHEIEGMELKDIAYVVDANAVTVRTRLFYARREFYKLVAEQGGPLYARAAAAMHDPDEGAP